MTEAGPIGLISDEDSGDSDRERSHAIKLPGVTKGICMIMQLSFLFLGMSECSLLVKILKCLFTMKYCCVELSYYMSACCGYT